MERKVIAYTIASSIRTPGLETAVEEMLLHGWHLYGSPFDSEGIMCQAMVQYAKSDEPANHPDHC